MEQQILTAAHKLYTQNGPDFTMEQLEAELNISRATIYRRLGSKQKILNRLAQQHNLDIDQHNYRQKILTAARTVFGRVGLIKATIEQIAAEANVGVATVYRHFGDKESLIHAFAAEMTPRNRLRDQINHASNDPAADLLTITQTLIPFFYQNRDIMRLLFLGSPEERHYFDSLRHSADSTLHALTTYFQHQIDAGHLHPIAPPQDTALAFIGLILSFTLIGPIHYQTSLTDTAQTAQTIVNIFLNNQLTIA
ncbi:MAG TPA: TetR/AcrR family transcriptional regulator [Anaerolineae bacterium]|nr:TetR/AcrR family transcriptional regulator [Anaerolineae bacterium]